ncbi:MAG: SIR2 family NAD-dependent protein deacylase [Desulfobacterales bacterium]
MDIDFTPLRSAITDNGKVTVLTGAGISAESGIPTFRGPEGYWTVGSREYHPQQMATVAMYRVHPFEVWKWYLYRAGVCRNASPNPGHYALVALEEHLGDRFTLITQNVDGLHLRAGNSPERTYHIHGNVFQMRCGAECSEALLPVPEVLTGRDRHLDLSEDERKLLRCPRCGNATRPHVLWFDEIYNEVFFRFESSLRKADETDLLIIVGTSGSTNLPNQVVGRVFRRGGAMVDINTEDNPFARLASKVRVGMAVRAPSSRVLPNLVQALTS